MSHPYSKFSAALLLLLASLSILCSPGSRAEDLTKIAPSGYVIDLAGVLDPNAKSTLTAIGQSPLLELLKSLRGVKLENGRVAVERATGRTANAKYFAGGDCVNGGREVVDAVADGKRAAVAIARVLEEAHVQT